LTGISLFERDKNDFRHHVSVVARNSILFSGTLWDYLVFGIPYVFTEQVVEMIHHAVPEDLVQSSPDDLNGMILEGGGLVGQTAAAYCHCRRF
jgi:ABC-type bacteriocin/lantibiotic exporter with double-glycine peptidase domain